MKRLIYILEGDQVEALREVRRGPPRTAHVAGPVFTPAGGELWRRHEDITVARCTPRQWKAARRAGLDCIMHGPDNSAVFGQFAAALGM